MAKRYGHRDNVPGGWGYRPIEDVLISREEAEEEEKREREEARELLARRQAEKEKGKARRNYGRER